MINFFAAYRSQRKHSSKKSRRFSDQDADTFSRPLPNIPQRRALRKLEENRESDDEYSYLDKRPEPIGEVVEARRVEDFDTLQNTHIPSKLPPLETKVQKKGGRKKKKKVLKKLVHTESDDEIL
jgi:hypothetical protein